MSHQFAWKRRVLLTAVLCLGLASMAAAGPLTWLRLSIPLPGVDRYGNIDLYHYSNVPFKVLVNSRTGKAYAIGKGRVRNQSRRLAIFRNQATANQGLINIPGAVIERDLYIVARKGRCLAIASGRFYGIDAE